MSMPVLKLRQVVGFPGSVYGDTGIAVTKANGNYTIENDWSQFATQSSPPSSSTNCLLNYDTVSKNYVLVPTNTGGIDTTTKAYIDAGDAANANGVKYTAQSLSSAQQTQARQNVYASPLDALAYNGMQINGGMEVSQEFGTTTAVTTNGSPLDGFVYNRSAGAWSGLAFPTPLSTLVPGFSSWLFHQVVTPQPSLAAGDYAVFQQPIEGYRVSRLAWGSANAQPVTLSFWSANAPAGIYTGVIRNADFTRSFPFTYTQAVANVPQYNTITIPGCTDGTWQSGNLAGLRITLMIAGGASVLAPSSGVWHSASYLGAPGQVNAISAAGTNLMRLTGLVILPGIEAPSAARSPFIMRPYDQELITCQRYWESGPQPFSYLGDTFSQTKSFGQMFFGQTKRAEPTVSITDWGYYSNGVSPTPAAPSVGSAGPTNFTYLATGLVGFGGWSGSGTWTANARL